MSTPYPQALEAIRADTQSLGFDMGSPELTGSLLCTLAVSKPGGRFLELGTGTGLATAWILKGMSADASLLTVDSDAQATNIAKKHLSEEIRVDIRTGDGLELLKSLQGESFDFIFADTWPGKIDEPELALNLVVPGGLYLVDDMQLAWKQKEQFKQPLTDMMRGVWEGQRRLIKLLGERNDFICTSLEWSTGIMICTKRAETT